MGKTARNASQSLSNAVNSRVKKNQISKKGQSGQSFVKSRKRKIGNRKKKNEKQRVYIRTLEEGKSKSDTDGIVCNQTLGLQYTQRGKTNKTVSFKERLKNKLESGKFRWINEKLYTSSSQCASELFENDPELFNVYHQGFSSQVEKWPVNPVDVMIEWIKKRSSSLVIVDMGCGEAKISQSVENEVHSFDLMATNEFVTQCDMAQVPRPDNSVDVVIFCLSLMGTNLVDFLGEAHRILRTRGVMKVAEVVSRFDDVTSFEKAVSRIGFKLTNKNTSNKMFVHFEFVKSPRTKDNQEISLVSLKPCLYKKR